MNLSFQLSVILFVLGSFFLSGCTFHSDEEFHKQIPFPDASGLKVRIDTVSLFMEDPQDTISIFGTTRFYVAVDGKHGAIERVQAFISDDDGISWKSVFEGGGQYVLLEKSDLHNGIFRVKVDVTMKTGSGSLMDKAGGEYFQASAEWILLIDFSPPPKPDVVLSVENGFLTVRWSGYKRTHFESYTIKRVTPYSIDKFEIKDKAVTKWRDENYVGGQDYEVQYTVSTTSGNGTAVSNTVRRTDPLVATSSFNIEDSTLTLRWNPTKFHGTFKEYELYITNTEKISLPLVTDTTVFCKIPSVRFGAGSNAVLTVRSKSPINNESGRLIPYKLGTPLSFTPGSQIMFNAYLNALVALDANGKLLHLDGNLQPVREIATTPASAVHMPYNGRYVYYTTCDEKEIHRLDVTDGSEVLFDISFFGCSNYTFSSTGLIGIDYNRPSRPIVYMAAVIDSETGTRVYNERTTTTDIGASVSEDGRFIWVNYNSVFRISGDVSEAVGTFHGVGKFLNFRPDNSDEILFRNGSTIDIYDTNTLTLLRSLNPPTPTTQYRRYDVQRKEVMWSSNSTDRWIYFMNIDNGATTKVAISSKASAWAFYTIDGYLIYENEYIKLPQ